MYIIYMIKYRRNDMLSHIFYLKKKTEKRKKEKKTTTRCNYVYANVHTRTSTQRRYLLVHTWKKKKNNKQTQKEQTLN